MASQAARALTQRGEREAKEMRGILETQRERIRRHQEKLAKGGEQLFLGIDPKKDEQRQLAADQRHWAARLESLKREIEEEPKRIQATYEVRASRVEPVGFVYLWPLSG